MRNSVFVIFAHILVIASVLYFQEPKKQNAVRRPIAVTTKVEVLAPVQISAQAPLPEALSQAPLQLQDEPIALSPPPPSEISPEVLPPDPEPIPTKEPITAAPSQQTPKEPPPVVIDPPKVKAPVAVAKPKVPQAPKTEKKLPVKPLTQKNQIKTTNPQQEKLIAMMQKSLKALDSSAHIKPTHDKPITQVPTIEKLASEMLSVKTKYEQELVLFLESFLSMPDKGDTRLKLTLKRDGHVEKIEITHSKSEQNKKYIEATLKTCLCPSFASYFKGEDTHTFSLTLKAK